MGALKFLAEGNPFPSHDFHRDRVCAAVALLLRVLVACLGAGAAAVQAAQDVPPARFTDAARKQKLIQVLPQIEVLMSDRIKELGTPGLAYAVIIDDEVVLAKGLGVRDVASGAPAEGESVFRMASMTKSFTALAILKLRDAGKLSLDDPVARYVLELSTWRPPTAKRLRRRSQ